jgi:hypothetical protein
VFVGEVVATRGEPQKAEYLYVRSNYKLFSSEGAQVPVGDHKHQLMARAMLSWQEPVDLQPEDESEVGSEIHYFVNRDGNVHAREFPSEDR